MDTASGRTMGTDQSEGTKEFHLVLVRMRARRMHFHSMVGTGVGVRTPKCFPLFDNRANMFSRYFSHGGMAVEDYREILLGVFESEQERLI